jgi:hypothetical protein
MQIFVGSISFAGKIGRNMRGQVSEGWVFLGVF